MNITLYGFRSGAAVCCRCLEIQLADGISRSISGIFEGFHCELCGIDTAKLFALQGMTKRAYRGARGGPVVIPAPRPVLAPPSPPLTGPRPPAPALAPGGALKLAPAPRKLRKELKGAAAAALLAAAAAGGAAAAPAPVRAPGPVMSQFIAPAGAAAAAAPAPAKVPPRGKWTPDGHKRCARKYEHGRPVYSGGMVELPGLIAVPWSERTSEGHAPRTAAELEAIHEQARIIADDYARYTGRELAPAVRK